LISEVYPLIGAFDLARILHQAYLGLSEQTRNKAKYIKPLFSFALNMGLFLPLLFLQPPYEYEEARVLLESVVIDPVAYANIRD